MAAAGASAAAATAGLGCRGRCQFQMFASAPTLPAPIVMNDRRAATFLTYDAGKKISVPKWPVRSAVVAVVLLSGTLLLAILGRSESRCID